MNDPIMNTIRFYSALCDIVKIFGETEIGDCEIDEDAVAEYCKSIKFTADFWGKIHDKEAIYQKVTDDILNGFPVWEFLKLSDWTKQRVENTFKQEQEAKYLELCRIYKCYTCKYFKSKPTDLGSINDCIYQQEQIKKLEDKMERRKRTLELSWKHTRQDFKPKKQCKLYIKQE